MTEIISPAVAVIVAGGSGSRFGGPVPKQYLPLAGLPVIRHTALAFLHHPQVSRVLVVIRPEDDALARAALEGLDIAAFIPGGADRQASVLAGLVAAQAYSPATVLIQDAARPLVSETMISAALNALQTHDGAVPALPVTDTLKRAEAGRIGGTLPREGLYRAQTPQCFRFDAILAAHRAAIGLSLTDDAAVAEAAGLTVALTPGDEAALKITTSGDLHRAALLLCPPDADTVTGTGFDVHAFDEGSFVTLCGVKIPHSMGLSGHSDADVALHALTDAILGAIADGDIGAHFPPSDMRWKGADSGHFLRHALDLAARRGARLVHCDITLICEAPKIGPHREAMRASLQKLTGLPLARLSVKATTTEKLGFTGRREGIAAQAAATLRLPPVATEQGILPEAMPESLEE